MLRARWLQASAVVAATALLMASSCSFQPGYLRGVPPPPGPAVPPINTHVKGRGADQLHDWAEHLAPPLGIPVMALEAYGYAARVAEDERHGHIRITGGGGESTATIIVSAATAEVRQERLRIAEDAAAAVQAALQGGLLPGGGAAEIAALPAVLAARKGATGMAAYGLDCVSEALKRPLAQIVANAGYNPLEKVEEVVAQAQPGAAIGVDCDTGETADMLALGVVDAAPVKLYALQAAGEIATAVLRIATVIRRRDERPDEAANGER